MPSDIEGELIEKTGLRIKRTESEDAFHMRLLDAADADAVYSKLSKTTKAWVDAAVTAANAGQALPAFDPGAGDDDDDEEEQPAAEPDDDDDEAEGHQDGEDAEDAEEKDDDAAEEDGDETESEQPADDETETDEKDVDMPSVQTEEAAPRRSRAQPKETTKAASRSKAAPAKNAARTAVKASAKTAPAKTTKTTARKAEGNSSKQGGVQYVRTLLCKEPNMSLEDIHAQTKRAGYDVALNTISTTASNFRFAARAMQEAGLLKKKMY